MLQIPSTNEQIQTNLTNIESKINQTTPATDKAFNKVIATEEGLAFTTLYKFGVERAKQNLALTATGSDLDLIGNEFNVPRKLAEACELTITIPATTGTIISATNAFNGIANGVRYTIDADATAVANVATINITASVLGVAGNLEVGDELTIETQIAGLLSTIGTVTVVNNIGADTETDDAYRIRILDKERSQGGGGNLADYRNWSQEVAGVLRTYPYSGRPASEGTSVPPDRTVYVESTTDIDPDGIAPAGLLDEVRESITYDANGKTRQPLGLTDETLWVEPITRSSFEVTITGLVVDSGIETQVKADVLSALITYFLSLRPYIDGLDFLEDKNDRITTASISEISQSIVAAYGGYYLSLTFNKVGSGTINTYQLSIGELAKLTLLTWS